MADIRALTREKPTQAVIDLGDGDTVTVMFDRNRITPVWMEAAKQRDEAQDSASLPKALSEVILSWDVTDGDQPFPPTAENLGVLSYPAQSSLLLRILEAAVPSSEEGNVSSAPSSSPAATYSEPVLTPPNGPVTSPSPAPSASPSPT